MVKPVALILAIASCAWAVPMGETLAQRDVPKIIMGSGVVARDTISDLNKRSSSNSKSEGKGGFSLPSSAQQKIDRNGPRALKHTLLKYKFPVPPALAALNTTLDPSMNSKRDGTIPAKSSDPSDQQYIEQFTIGGQKFNMNIDTGSSDFWVFSNNTPKAMSQGHNIYTPSRTAKALPGLKFNITYGDNSNILGTVVSDSVSINGLSVTQSVQMPTAISDSFTQNLAVDGLVGLGFSWANSVTPPQNTFFKNAIPSLSQPIFTANLKKYPTVGSFDFGYVNSSLISTSVYYTNVTSDNGHWEFPAPKYRVGSMQYNDVVNTSAVVDTGTTIILVSSAMAANYYAQVSGARYDTSYAAWLFPCSSTLPSLALAVGTFYGQLPGSYMNFGPVDTTGTTCYGNLQGYDGRVYIYGDVFFKAFFAVFDQGTATRGPRFGIAGHK